MIPSVFPTRPSPVLQGFACLRHFGAFRAALLLGIAVTEPSAVRADATPEEATAARQALATKTFDEKIAPFVKSYCTECHGDKVRKGGVTFRNALKNPGASDFRKQWKLSAANVKSHEMPPEDAKKQPTAEEVRVFADWVAEMKHLSPKDPGLFVLRRLNKVEYGNTLHDLLGSDPGLARELPDEVFGAGYLNTLSPLLMEQYLTIANEVLNSVWAPGTALPPELQKRLFGGVQPPRLGGSPEDLRAALRALARIAYRRPPTDEELDVLAKVFDLAKQAGRSEDACLRLLLKAVLVSPQFLFITPENGAGPEHGIVPLDDFQLAARLSYLLWSTQPDAELSALADAGKLREPAVLDRQVRRLLAHPRARALFDGFGAQWLGVEKLATKTFDAAKFPQMDTGLRAAMYDEARLLFESIVRENASLVRFVDCDYTFLNGPLAAVYGLEGEAKGAEMRRVQLRNPNRGGILGMPGILATTSFPDRTSPVNRGVWVLEQLLGEHVPPPPPNVPTLEKQDKKKIANLTLRQRTELHRTNAVCMSCHKVLDPIGFGLENFDAIGRWREQDDSGGPIDAAGELPGAKRFSSPMELKAIVAERADDFSRNLVEKMLAYALGRQLEGYDEIVVDRLSEAVAKDGYRMQTLITQLVSSYPFTHRRVGEQNETSNGKKLAN
jgi:cytochrome c5